MMRYILLLESALICLIFPIPVQALVVPAACTVFSKPGDISLGGIIPFRYSSTSLCNQDSGISLWGVRSAEAMVWAIEDINSNDQILPNITIGYQIRDDCRSEDVALWSALALFVDTCSGENDVKVDSNLVGIIGGGWSSTAVWMAKVGNLFEVPLISWSATSDELSDTVRFPYFFRTIPPDRYQVGAIMDILLKFNWRYIALIFSTDTYGIHGGRQIKQAAEANGICLALSASIQPYAPKYEIDEVINKLRKVPKVKVAVIFSLSTVAYAFLNEIQSRNLRLNITWIGSDGWGGSAIYKYNLGNLTQGSLFLRVMSRELGRFNEYFRGLTANNHSGSPWFDAYWENYKQSNCTTTKQCQFSEYTDGIRIINGVKALGFALDAMLKDSCLRNECYSKDKFTGMELKDYLYNVSFNTTDGRFIFDRFGDSSGLYRIENIQKDRNGFKHEVVGYWDPRNQDSQLDIDLDKMQFFGGSKSPKPSLCREECLPGYILVPLEEKCCFGCQACPENAIVNSSVCEECRETHWPNANFTQCNRINPSPVNLKDPIMITIIFLACVGIALSLSVAFGLWICKNHPLVKATSRELSIINVFGLTLAFLDVFTFVAPPTRAVCLVAESFLSLSFTIIIVPTLLKVIRIYRIFKAGKKSVRRPRFVGIRDQLIMTTVLISIQIGILVIFGSIYKTKPAELFKTPPQNYIGIYCGLRTGFLVSSVYNLILIVVCCYYAFLARKVPSNYNESKFIGISVYSMLIITLAAIPLYSTAGYILQLVTTVAAALLLNAYLGLVCVYLPKLYAVYFKGDQVDVEDWRTRTGSLSIRASQVQPSAE
ncbi:metabotropic glutamate receptor-like [Amphiura filiformis]|uniref:metabotropic glutamate receptor-like n=1 Tax=Amphiura filiformis TaxID=82378 RepID=UPI003B21D118